MLMIFLLPQFVQDQLLGKLTLRLFIPQNLQTSIFLPFRFLLFSLTSSLPKLFSPLLLVPDLWLKSYQQLQMLPQHLLHLHKSKSNLLHLMKNQLHHHYQLSLNLEKHQFQNQLQWLLRSPQSFLLVPLPLQLMYCLCRIL